MSPERVLLVLAVVSTALLGAGTLAAAAARQPLHQKRAAELAVIAGLGWMLLAFLPLPRPLVHVLEGLGRQRPRAPAEALLPAAGPRPDLDPAPRPATPHPALAPPPAMMGSVAPAAAAASSARAALHKVAATPPPAAAPAGPAAEAGPVAPVASLPSLPSPAGVVLLLLALGGAGFAVRLLGGVLRLARMLRAAAPAPDGVARLAADLAARAAVPAPRVLAAEDARTPFCLGGGRGTIVLPAWLCGRAHAAMLRHVLAHEVAHLRHRDARGHLLMAAASPLLWWHPLFWWLRSRARFAAELLADDWAAAVCGTGGYARSLIALSARQVRPGPGLLAGMAAAGSGSEFYRRMKMLLQREQPLAARCSAARRSLHAAALLAAVSLSGAALGMQEARVQERVEAEEILRIQEAEEVARIQEEAPGAAEACPPGAQEAAQKAQEEARRVLDLQAALSLFASLQRQRSAPVAAAAAPSIALTAETVPVPAAPLIGVLDLVSAVLDLRGEVHAAQLRLKNLDTLASMGMADHTDRSVAEVRLHTLVEKQRILQRLVLGEMQAAEIEVESLSRGRAGEHTPQETARVQAALARARARLEALQALQ